MGGWVGGVGKTGAAAGTVTVLGGSAKGAGIPVGTADCVTIGVGRLGGEKRPGGKGGFGGRYGGANDWIRFVLTPGADPEGRVCAMIENALNSAKAAKTSLRVLIRLKPANYSNDIPISQ